MVLTTGEGGAVAAGRTPGQGSAAASTSACRVGGARRLVGEAGSQVLEFAMVLPLLGIGLALLAQTGLLLADLLAVQGIARQAARTAAVEGDVDAVALADRLASSRELRLDVERADGLVEVRAELASRAFTAAGVDVWLPARATFHDEADPGG